MLHTIARIHPVHLVNTDWVHQTWYGDTEPRACSCTSKTFGVWRSFVTKGAENMRETQLPQLKTPTVSLPLGCYDPLPPLPFLLRNALYCIAGSCNCMSSVRLSVCPSVKLVDHDHIGWKSWKLIVRTISPTPSLFIAQRSSTYSKGNVEKCWGDQRWAWP